MKSQLVYPKDNQYITVIGAHQNNLKNVSLSIPKHKITVFTGISGSGKSTLAFKTIAAESQRLINENYSSFIRHRLLHYGLPQADAFYNIPASIVVDQKPLGGGKRSTIGTATEIHSLLRLLFSRTGVPSAGLAQAYSFNHPTGMCPHCQGLGELTTLDLDKVLDKDKSLNEGAILFPTFAPNTFRWKRYVHSGFFDNDKPLRDYSKEEWDLLLYADDMDVKSPSPEWHKTAKYQGLIPRFSRAYLDHEPSKLTKAEKLGLVQYVSSQQCPYCHGSRINSPALKSKILGFNIADCLQMEARELLTFLGTVELYEVQTVVLEAKKRLQQMEQIGLGYLSLDRSIDSLSGGESQRVKMVKYLGSSLSDIVYVFDEPSQGLHSKDIHQFIDLAKQLKKKGNTVLIVEHHNDIIKTADNIVDMGPHAGIEGGQVVFQGPPQDLHSCPTPTGRWLSKQLTIKTDVRHPRGYLEIIHATRHNLKDFNIKIPRGVLTAVVGVAGSGKSTLTQDLLPQRYPQSIVLNQAPIQGNSRSSIASYMGILDSIREIYARHSGKSKSLFSPNSAGACPHCKGLGIIKTDLAFMDDIETVCESCHGSGFNEESRSIYWQDMNIDDLLRESIAEIRKIFKFHKQILSPLEKIIQVGLDYIHLGRRVSTLSGGELQRLKLAKALLTPSSLYILDEPTSGLHGSDTEKILKIIDHLVDQGCSVIVVEHNLEVIAQADWLIELGPGAGKDGGKILFQGTPHDSLNDTKSIIGPYLKKRQSTRSE